MSSQVNVSKLCSLHIKLIQEHIRKNYYIDATPGQAVSYAIGLWLKQNVNVNFNVPIVPSVHQQVISGVNDDVKIGLLELSKETGYRVPEIASALIVLCASSFHKADLAYNASEDSVISNFIPADAQ